jgi:hypothetical protein
MRPIRNTANFRPSVITVSAFFILVSVAVPAQQQQLRWSLETYGTMQETQTAINDRLDRGLVPVGIETDDNGSFDILFVAEPAVQAIGVDVETARLHRSTTRELSTFLGRQRSLGSTPIDIARAGETMYVLTFPSGWTDADFRLAFALKSEQSFRSTLQRYGAAGYFPVGISMSSSEPDVVAWTFLRSGNWNPPATTLASYEHDPETIRRGVSAALANRGIPWGFASSNSEFVVTYIRLEALQPADEGRDKE